MANPSKKNGGKSNRSNKSTPKGGKSLVRRNQSSAIQKYIPTTLDKAGRDYLRLIMDPCNAPLTYSLNPMTGAFVARYSKDMVVTGTTGLDYGLFLQPGNYMLNNGLGGMYECTNATPSANMVLNGRSLPGQSQMVTMAASARPIAGCVDCYYGGTELARAGMVYKLHSNAGTFTPVDSNQIPMNTMLSNCFKRERMPDHQITMRWRPNSDADLEFCDPNTPATTALTLERKSQVGLLFPVMAAGLTLTFRITIVWEWIPRMDSGAVSSPYSVHSSSNHSGLLGILDKAEGWIDRISDVSSSVSRVWERGKNALTFLEGAAPLLMA